MELHLSLKICLLLCILLLFSECYFDFHCDTEIIFLRLSSNFYWVLLLLKILIVSSHFTVFFECDYLTLYFRRFVKVLFLECKNVCKYPTGSVKSNLFKLSFILPFLLFFLLSWYILWGPVCREASWFVLLVGTLLRLKRGC